ncbi:MAG TPA: hypothetical protein VF460_10455 [Burkholderiales bacterium]
MSSMVRASRYSLFVLVLAGSSPAWSQQKYPIATNSGGQTSKYIQQHKIDVGDVPGHQVRIQETHRVYNDKSTLAFADVKVKEGWIQGYSDYTNGKGKAWGYGHYVLEDGSKVFFEYVGTSHSESTATGSLKGTYHGTTRFVGGTGKYKGIRGTTTDTVGFDNDPKTGYNNSDGKGEYWFEE